MQNEVTLRKVKNVTLHPVTITINIKIEYVYFKAIYVNNNTHMLSQEY